MKFESLVYFIVILLISVNSFGKDQKNDIEKYCFQKYSDSVKNYQDRTVEDIVHSWEKHTHECSQYGIYKRYLADIYMEYGYYEKGENILEDEIKNASYDTRKLEFLLGSIYSKHKSFSKYKTLIERMFSKYPNWFGGYYHLGIYNSDYKKDLDNSERSLLKALELVDNSDSYLVLSSLAILKYKQGKDKEVLEYYEKAFERNPLYVATSLALAIPSIYSFITLKDYQAASDVIRNIEKYDPSVLKNSDYLEAKAYYERAVKAKEEKGK